MCCAPQGLIAPSSIKRPRLMVKSWKRPRFHKSQQQCKPSPSKQPNSSFAKHTFPNPLFEKGGNNLLGRF
jgi:hypothetical protein